MLRDFLLEGEGRITPLFIELAFSYSAPPYLFVIQCSPNSILFAMLWQVHLWRRSLVVVKRFKLDFLTRDNIVLFKKEASVLRRLSHPNVIQFYGVVIDPPCMAIVMAHGTRGDLFTHLRKLNRALMNARRSSSLWARNANGRSPWLQSADGATSFAQSNANSTHDSSSRSSAAASAIYSGGAAAARGSLLETGLSFCPLKCALDVAMGMKYLHSHGMVHCDLKVRNLFAVCRKWHACCGGSVAPFALSG